MKKAGFLCSFVVFMGFISAQAAPLEVGERDIDLIDTPTADVLDRYGYDLSFRFGRDGDLQVKTLVGPFPRLNVGVSFDGERVLGTEDSRLNRPAFHVKFRLFDGKKSLPALAVGFDDQGYVFNKALDEYEQREKGLYLAGTKPLFFPGLLWSFGVNLFDFEESNPVRAFSGLAYTYRNVAGLLLEYDSVTEYIDRRINFGLKFFLTPLFTIDFIGRNVPVGTGRSKRITERVIRLGYTGSF